MKDSRRGVLFILITAVLLLCLLEATLAQDQITIQGDDGLQVIVNTTSNFGVQILRQLNQLQTSPNPVSSTTPGLPRPTTSASNQTTESTTAHSIIPSKTGVVDVSVVGMKEIDDTWKAITVAGHYLARDELMSRGYFRKSVYQASLNSDNSLQASCSQFIANPVQDAAPKGALNFTLCVARNNGTVSRAGAASSGSVTESFQVTVGQLWISVQVSSWTWCNSCTKDGERNVSGAYMNVELEVTVNKQSDIKTTDSGVGKPVRYILGEDATMDLFKLVTIDSQTEMKVMPNNYPTLALADGDSKATITVSVPRFITSATFYQVIDPGHHPAPKEGSQVVGGASKLSSVSVHLFVWALALGILRSASLVYM